MGAQHGLRRGERCRSPPSGSRMGLRVNRPSVPSRQPVPAVASPPFHPLEVRDPVLLALSPILSCQPPPCHPHAPPGTLSTQQLLVMGGGMGLSQNKAKQQPDGSRSSRALCLAALSILRPHLPLPFRLLHPRALSRLLSFRTWPGCFSAKLQDRLLVPFQAPAWLSPCQSTLPDLPSAGSPSLPALLSHLRSGLCKWILSLLAACFLPPSTPKPRVGTQWLRSPHTLSVVFLGLDPLL